MASSTAAVSIQDTNKALVYKVGRRWNGCVVAKITPFSTQESHVACGKSHFGSVNACGLRDQAFVQVNIEKVTAV